MVLNYLKDIINTGVTNFFIILSNYFWLGSLFLKIFFYLAQIYFPILMLESLQKCGKTR